MNNEPFVIVPPATKQVPIVLSVPHCGIDFPEEIRADYDPQLIAQPDDTDWFVHQLYDFAPHMGITMIYAKYSRWVIDLNRDPKNISLYNDGRIITELVPTKTFFGQDLYRNEIPNAQEIENRLQRYYWPYHHKIEELLQQLQQHHSHVLLYDAHSIRQIVPTIRTQPFPDLILGNQDGKTADSSLIQTALNILQNSDYLVQHNDPFKGGTITRHFGRPDQKVHALQLEMTKNNYMDEEKTLYDLSKADKMRELLKKLFVGLIDAMEKL